jgi:hypothetical protein
MVLTEHGSSLTFLARLISIVGTDISIGGQAQSSLRNSWDVAEELSPDLEASLDDAVRDPLE